MSNRPSREELIELAKRDPEAIADLVLSLFDRLEKLEQEMAELKRNSRNSSKPPSSDRNNPNKPPKSQRQRGKRKPGGQKGHPGHYLKPVEDPDVVVTHRLKGRCGCCGEDLSKAHVDGCEKRQVFDLPEKLTLEATEHRAESGRCAGCGKEYKACFPPEVRAPVQYGERVQAMVVYLSTYQLVPCDRLSELCGDLFDCPLSPGTVVNMVERAGSRASPIAEEIKEQVKQADWIHCDETGINLVGNNRWLHVACTPQWTYFHVDEKRGYEALQRIGILDEYTGWVVHDYYSSYYRFEKCNHGLCNVHHLRDLTYIAEDLGQSWAAEMKSLLLEMKKRKGPRTSWREASRRHNTL
jgi:transposase